MSQQSRRSFLKKTAVAGLGATFAIGGTKATGKVVGANDRIRVAVAGIHGRGQSHIDAFSDMKGVEVTTLVDPDTRLFESRTKMVQKLGGNTPKCYTDIRKALEDQDLDAVSIATCNHWHALITIWACQAGKDVYVEKPCSHNVFEGRKAVEAARKYNRIVQHGTQQRSSEKRANEIAALHAGKYGKLLVAKGYCCKPRWSIGYKPNVDPPKGVDFNIWLGPALMQQYHENLVHYNWHWFWDFGNGDMGNQGVHEMDVARWGIKGATLPSAIWSAGGRWVQTTEETPDHKDQGQTPNMLLSILEYGDVQLVFETRGLVGKKPAGATKMFERKVADEFYTTEGKLVDDTFYPKNGGKPEKIADQGAHITPGGPFASFITAVRSRKIEDVNADILEGHYSSAACHLGSISYRMAKPAPFSETPHVPSEDQETLASWERLRENLAGAGVELADTSYQVGPLLKFDPKTEKFIDNPQADKLLTRPYRAPFVVPNNV